MLAGVECMCRCGALVAFLDRSGPLESRASSARVPAALGPVPGPEALTANMTMVAGIGCKSASGPNQNLNYEGMGLYAPLDARQRTEGLALHVRMHIHLHQKTVLAVQKNGVGTK